MQWATREGNLYKTIYSLEYNRDDIYRYRIWVDFQDYITVDAVGETPKEFATVDEAKLWVEAMYVLEIG